MAESLSDILARTPAGGTAAIPAGEFEGPVRIDKTVHLKGNNTTVWARHGSVLEINAPGVTVEGLRVEITEGLLSETAISARFPAEIRNVEILGAAEGFGEEDGAAEIPRTLALGEISAGGENTFRMTVDIPAAAVIQCQLPGVKFEPAQLPAGRSEVKITVEGSGSPALIYTEVLLQSRFRRRIYLSGRFSQNAPAARDKLLFEAQPVDRAKARRSLSAPSSGGTAGAPAVSPSGAASGNNASGTAAGSPSDVISNVGFAPLADAPVFIIKRGQRIPAAAYIGGRCDIYLTGERLGAVDIDPYVFLLDERERAVGETGRVFFGNERSEDGAVRYYKDDGHIGIDFSMLSPSVKRISVVYSVYSGNAQKNFSLVREPVLSLFAQEKERVQFIIDGLRDEVTIVAAEFYIYKGEWRISAVGGGFRDGLVKLCNRYGIEVSG